MTGLPDHNYPAFHEAARHWRDSGHTVFNPADNFDGDQYHPGGKPAYMREDVRMIADCDAIALLPGWERSEGSLIEVMVGKALGLKFFDAERFYELDVSHVREPFVILHDGDDWHQGVMVRLATIFQQSGWPTWAELDDLTDYYEEGVYDQRREAPLFENGVKSIREQVKERLASVAPETLPAMPKAKGKGEYRGVDGQGYKSSMDDPNKPQMWLVPAALNRAVAYVMAHGARKYSANNWRRGMPYSEVFSALQRHLYAWLEGEDEDGDSGMNHLWHAACCLAFLCEYVEHDEYAQFDNRFKREEVAS